MRLNPSISSKLVQKLFLFALPMKRQETSPQIIKVLRKRLKEWQISLAKSILSIPNLPGVFLVFPAEHLHGRDQSPSAPQPRKELSNPATVRLLPSSHRHPWIPLFLLPFFSERDARIGRNERERERGEKERVSKRGEGRGNPSEKE